VAILSGPLLFFPIESFLFLCRRCGLFVFSPHNCHSLSSFFLVSILSLFYNSVGLLHPCAVPVGVTVSFFSFVLTFSPSLFVFLNGRFLSPHEKSAPSRHSWSPIRRLSVAGPSQEPGCPLPLCSLCLSLAVDFLFLHAHFL